MAMKEKNWFEKMPHWAQLLFYFGCGVLIGLMIPYI